MADETKQEILDDIAAMLQLERWQVSTGSTEPREALVAIATELAIKVRPDASKPEIAADIARAGGEAWDASCDSVSSPSGGGGTVTHEGLKRVRAAVQQLIRIGPPRPRRSTD